MPVPARPSEPAERSVAPSGPVAHLAATTRPPWVRRAAILASAAALVGATALSGVGTAIPAPQKEAQAGLVAGGPIDYLEAVPARTLPAAGVAVVSRVDGTLKNGVPAILSPEAFAAAAAAGATGAGGAPTCVALPLAEGYRLTSNYGYRIHPISRQYSLHTGMDMAAPLGTPIHAVTDGTVVYTGAGRQGRSSELVIIEHQVNGTTFFSWYVHMYPDGVFVTVGQQVKAGEVIAEVGNNGNSTGPHLHFEIHTSDGTGGSAKSPIVRTTSSVVPFSVPAPTPTDTSGWAVHGEFLVHPGTGLLLRPDGVFVDPTTLEPTDPPADFVPTPPPTDPPTTDPPTTEPPTTEPPTTEPPTTEPPTTEPPTTEPPTTPPPTGEPTPPPTGEPTPPPPTGEPTTPPATAPPTGSPTTPPGATPSPTPAPSPTPGATPTPGPTAGGGAGEERTQHAPFPIAAYGTTVDPVRFLATLGIDMVDPRRCS